MYLFLLFQQNSMKMIRGLLKWKPVNWKSQISWSVQEEAETVEPSRTSITTLRGNTRGQQASVYRKLTETSPPSNTEVKLRSCCFSGVSVTEVTYLCWLQHNWMKMLIPVQSLPFWFLASAGRGSCFCICWTAKVTNKQINDHIVFHLSFILFLLWNKISICGQIDVVTFKTWM